MQCTRAVMSIRVTVSLMSHANITITSGHRQTAADTSKTFAMSTCRQ